MSEWVSECVCVSVCVMTSDKADWKPCSQMKTVGRLKFLQLQLVTVARPRFFSTCCAMFSSACASSRSLIQSIREARELPLPHAHTCKHTCTHTHAHTHMQTSYLRSFSFSLPIALLLFLSSCQAPHRIGCLFVCLFCLFCLFVCLFVAWLQKGKRRDWQGGIFSATRTCLQREASLATCALSSWFSSLRERWSSVCCLRRSAFCSCSASSWAHTMQ